MTPTILSRVDRFCRDLLPPLSTLLAVVLTVLPVGLPNLAIVMPLFTLMAIYYWTLTRPNLMPSPFIFLVGLFQDSLSGSPMGLWAIVFLTGHFFVVTQRRLLAGQSFALTWFGFSVLAVIASGLAWVIVCAFYTRLVPFGPSAVQALLTIILYPPVTLCLAQIHRLLPRGP